MCLEKIQFRNIQFGNIQLEKKQFGNIQFVKKKNSLEKIQFRIFVVVALQRQVTQSEPYSAFLNEGVMGGSILGSLQ